MSSKSFNTFEEVQHFVENAWNRIPTETLENTIKGMKIDMQEVSHWEESKYFNY